MSSISSSMPLTRTLARAEARVDTSADNADQASKASQVDRLRELTLAELHKKQLDEMRKRAAVVKALNSAATDVAKAAARERLEMIKKRIEALLQMLALMGGKGAKALLQELKQLSNQAKQAAAVLRADSGDSGSSDAGAPPDQASAGADADAGAASAPGADGQGAAGASAEGRQAYAEQQLASDTDARLDHAQSHDDKDDGDASAAAASMVPVAVPASALSKPHTDAQKMEDERLIQSTLRALESLRNSVEKLAKQELQSQQAARQRAAAG
ncbi:MAG: hypothetical protein ABW202_11405 [Duganella sp.]